MCVRIIAVAVTALAVTFCVTSGPSVSPRVTASASAQGCTPLGELPAELDQIEPWLVSLTPYTGGDDDVAFLCRANGSERRMLLVVDTPSGGGPWHACGSSIKLTTQFDPQGLGVVEPGDPVDFARVPLDRWRTKGGGAMGPAGVKPTAPILDTSGGIAGWAYYCHEGSWLALFVH